jgi:hypothetical protein
VPGHEGIDGNETADQLARTGSERPFIGPEPACGISIGVAHKVVRDCTNRNHKKTLGLKQAKGLILGSVCQKDEGSVKIKQRRIKVGKVKLSLCLMKHVKIKQRRIKVGKVKLSLCLIKHYAMKAYGRVDI